MEQPVLEPVPIWDASTAPEDYLAIFFTSTLRRHLLLLLLLFLECKFVFHLHSKPVFVLTVGNKSLTITHLNHCSHRHCNKLWEKDPKIANKYLLANIDNDKR